MRPGTLLAAAFQNGEFPRSIRRPIYCRACRPDSEPFPLSGVPTIAPSRDCLPCPVRLRPCPMPNRRISPGWQCPPCAFPPLPRHASVLNCRVALHQTSILPSIRMRQSPGRLQCLELAYKPPMRVCRSEEHTSELQSLMRISYAV